MRGSRHRKRGNRLARAIPGVQSSDESAHKKNPAMRRIARWGRHSRQLIAQQEQSDERYHASRLEVKTSEFP